MAAMITSPQTSCGAPARTRCRGDHRVRVFGCAWCPVSPRIHTCVCAPEPHVGHSRADLYARVCALRRRVHNHKLSDQVGLRNVRFQLSQQLHAPATHAHSLTLFRTGLLLPYLQGVLAVRAVSRQRGRCHPSKHAGAVEAPRNKAPAKTKSARRRWRWRPSARGTPSPRVCVQ